MSSFPASPLPHKVDRAHDEKVEIGCAAELLKKIHRQKRKDVIPRCCHAVTAKLLSLGWKTGWNMDERREQVRAGERRRQKKETISELQENNERTDRCREEEERRRRGKPTPREIMREMAREKSSSIEQKRDDKVEGRKRRAKRKGEIRREEKK